MHGRKKSDLPKTREETDALKAKVSSYTNIVGAVFQRRQAGAKDPDFLDLLGKVLRINPDFNSLWNWRREILLEGLSPAPQNAIALTNATDPAPVGSPGGTEFWGEGGPDGDRGGLAQASAGSKVADDHAVRALVAGELPLTEDCMRRNPKSYCVWHHRRWVVQLGTEGFSGGAEGLLKGELELCRLLLEMDGRNFHCWSYRQWVVEMLPLPLEEDFAFTTYKIEQNFSNYSAFHYRSKLLPAMALREAGPGRKAILDQELDMVHQAIYTEPDDQSAWWYHRFLVFWAGEGLVEPRQTPLQDLPHRPPSHPGAASASPPTAPGVGALAMEEYGAVLRLEIACLRELLEVEERSKWALLTLLFLLRTLHSSGFCDSDPSVPEECQRINIQLRELDPAHRKHYEHLALERPGSEV